MVVPCEMFTDVEKIHLFLNGQFNNSYKMKPLEEAIKNEVYYLKNTGEHLHNH